MKTPGNIICPGRWLCPGSGYKWAMCSPNYCLPHHVVDDMALWDIRLALGQFCISLIFPLILPPTPLWISQLAHAGWCGVNFLRLFLLAQFSIGGCWVFCQGDVTRYWLDPNLRAQERGASDFTCCYSDVHMIHEESSDQVDNRLRTFSSTLAKFKHDCTTSYFKIFGQTVIIDVANFWRMV